jgi:hypothetical protein
VDSTRVGCGRRGLGSIAVTLEHFHQDGSDLGFVLEREDRLRTGGQRRLRGIPPSVPLRADEIVEYTHQVIRAQKAPLSMV